MRFFYDDLCRTASLSDASFGTNWRQVRPATNVQVPGIAASGAWVFGSESPDTQAVRLRFDFGTAKNINFIGIMGHAGFTDGTGMSLQLGTSAGASDVLNWSASSLDFAPDGEMQNFYQHFLVPYSAQHLQIQIDTTEFQAPSIGRILAGECWEVGAEPNFQIGYRDKGRVNRSLSGVAHPVERGRLKEMSLRFIGVGDEDLIGTTSAPMSFLDMDAKAGSTGEVCAFIDISDSFHRNRYGIYGFMEQNAPASARAKSTNGYVTSKNIKIISAA
jgi:hypothetical protein